MPGPWSNPATSLIVLSAAQQGYSGLFAYSPAPGAGNLVFSLSAVAGTDPWGNVYPAGLDSKAGNSTIEGTDYIIDGNGAFFYSPGIGAGNLAASIAATAGTDSYGNAYDAGMTLFGTTFQTQSTPGTTRLKIDQYGEIIGFNVYGAQVMHFDPGNGQYLIYEDLGSATQGSLIASVASAAGTDGFGNAYKDGFTVYNLGAGLYTQIVKGNGVYVGAAGYSDLQPGQMALTGAQFNSYGAAVLYSPIEAATDTRAWIAIESGTSGGQGPIAYVNGKLVASLGTAAVDPSNGAAVETWHSLGSPSATGYTVVQGRYRLTPDGEAEIDIQLQANSGGGTAGLYTFANLLPSAYQFPGTVSRSYPLGYNGTVTSGANAGSALIDPAGSANPGRVRIQIPALPAGTVIGSTFRIPLN